MFKFIQNITNVNQNYTKIPFFSDRMAKISKVDNILYCPKGKAQNPSEWLVAVRYLSK